MADRNLDIVRRTFDAVNARDFASVRAVYADDVVLAIHGDVRSLAGSGAVGKEALLGWFSDWFRTFERDYRFEIASARAEGDDRVLVDVTHHARGRASGAEVTMQSHWVFELRDGKIVRCDGYTRPAA